MAYDYLTLVAPRRSEIAALRAEGWEEVTVTQVRPTNPITGAIRHVDPKTAVVLRRRRLA